MNDGRGLRRIAAGFGLAATAVTAAVVGFTGPQWLFQQAPRGAAASPNVNATLTAVKAADHSGPQPGAEAQGPAMSAPVLSVAALPGLRSGGLEGQGVLPEVYGRAQAIHAVLSASRDGCRGAREGLLGLLRETPRAQPVWGWAMDRAVACLRAPRDARLGPDFLEELARLYPDHPKVREQLGAQAYDNGDAREAIEQLEQAVRENGTFEAWETLADARLALAAELQANGNAEDALILWQQAQDAALNALAMATPAMRPFAMHTLARAELELGRAAPALQWADQSLAALAALDARTQTLLAPELYLFAGQIYYRAGQRDTGVAYMDQGVGMAQSARQVAELQRLRDEFLRTRS